LRDTYLIFAYRPWYQHIHTHLSKRYPDKEFLCIHDKKLLTPEYISSLTPKAIFLPHWSYPLPESLYKNYPCITFHLSDVPYGQGGSPLQNLIANGFKETKLSAIQVQETLYEGPVYTKRHISLLGTADEIYMRSALLIEEMIVEIIENNPIPRAQEGEPFLFQVRNPEQSNISELKTLESLYDLIRMLDAEGYPAAFLENASYRFELTRASLKLGHILADVKITLK
jgi:methionyl-tRNA formyltransferase